jgi:cytoskeletal protein CcmA (bactofilin family)
VFRSIAVLKPSPHAAAGNPAASKSVVAWPSGLRGAKAEAAAPVQTVAEPSVSLISSDLSIVGPRVVVISRGTLRVEGHIEGDVHGARVIVGETGRVAGTVCGATVEINGQVSGAIKSPRVQLSATSLVSGDIHHETLVMAEGAVFDGRVRRPADPAGLLPLLDLDQHINAAIPIRRVS